MSFEGYNAATVTPVAANSVATTLFTTATEVHGRYIWNGSTAPCYVQFGTTASTTVYTTQIATNTGFQLPLPTFTGMVTGIWATANGSAQTTQW